MDDILLKYPKWLIVGGALAVGLILILLLDPPYSKCDAQFEVFQKAQTPFIFKDTTKKFNDQTDYQIVSRNCIVEKLPGACLKFFEGLRQFVVEFDSVSLECTQEIASKSEVRNLLEDSLDKMINLAWGEKPPASYLDKAGWFDTVHLNIYCDVLSIYKQNFGESEWEVFREKVLSALVASSSLDRKEVWNRSLFSIKCE